MPLDGGKSKRSKTDVAERPFWSPVTAEEAVANGVWLLDRRQPGWRSQMHPKYFDLTHACKCILGQVFGDYTSGILTLDIVHTAGEHGFIRVNGLYDYPDLKRAWRKALAA